LTDAHRRSLERLAEEVAALSDDHVPETTLSILEHGLGDQRKLELYVNRLLRYVLDPDAAHGLGTTLLEQFLRALPDACGIDVDTTALTDITVDDQVPVYVASTDTGVDSHPKYADLVLTAPDEWLLLVELKFGAAQTSTEDYCRAVRVGSHDVTADGLTWANLYIHRSDRAPARGACFANRTWATILDDVLDPVIADHTPRLPTRTATQLRALRDDIHAHIPMSEFDGLSDETALYIDHADAIETVSTAYHDDVRAFLDAIESRYADGWATSITRSRSNPYVQIYESSWRDVANGVNLEFEPHPEFTGGGPTTVDEPHVNVRFDVEHGDAQAIRDDLLDELGADGRAVLDEAGFSWYDTAQHSYKFVCKSVLLSELGDQSLIDATTEAIDERWAILEEPVTTVVQRYES
jgi:hypothetical protein